MVGLVASTVGDRAKIAKGICVFQQEVEKKLIDFGKMLRLLFLLGIVGSVAGLVTQGRGVLYDSILDTIGNTPGS